MKAFAELLDRLAYTHGRNEKLRLLKVYFARTTDPDRGWALAALADGLAFSFPIRRTVIELIGPKLDAELFRLSRDYVGDTAETVALVWPEPEGKRGEPPRLSEVVKGLERAGRGELPRLLEGWLDRLDANGRWALLKLLTGALRVGVSARLAKTALAEMGGREVSEIEEVWHGLSPPYEPLFAWLTGTAPRPDVTGAPVFLPLMLSHPLEDEELAHLDVGAFSIEWKWDGIRVQVVSTGATTRLYSRTGDDISRSFPEIVEGWRGQGVFDGELLIVREGAVAPFADLQRRLNRKTVSRRMLEEYPAHIRLYDALRIGDADLRSLALCERRARLEAWWASGPPPRTDLSPLVAVGDKNELIRLWSGTRGVGIEGMMLKRRQSPYLAGRPKGHWYKWKRASLTLDCVLMYAQRGSGKRSSFYSDYTFGVWAGTLQDSELVAVGKAYSGYTDQELLELDRWIRQHTLERFGPVRRVEPTLVLEVAFDAVQRSSRHKSGVAMRFPRIHRIRWEKPAREADRLDTVIALLEPKTATGHARGADEERPDSPWFRLR
ncbi:MAG TPA: cisplatin damage response ATP-dependent DNA ligase [Hyphomicrobiaceae bacterium]|nr:cisplatin damage response ATP-dependent DNA ligase [Hyphomicrobiaceae bacterium]